MAKSRHCKQGHRVAGKNAVWHKDRRLSQEGYWECRECKRAVMAGYWETRQLGLTARQDIRRRTPEGAEVHNKHNRHRTQHRLATLQLSLGDACICGAVERLHFHHKDPSTKLFNISSGAASRPMAELKQEVAKTILLCPPCHRAVHRSMRALKLAA